MIKDYTFQLAIQLLLETPTGSFEHYGFGQ